MRCAICFAANASSPLGQRKVSALTPSLDETWISAQQELTDEVREFRRVGGSFDFSGLLDIRQQIEKSRIEGAVLEIERDSWRHSRRGSRRGMAQDSISPPSQHENGVGPCSGSDCGHTRFRRFSAIFPQQN